MLGFPGQDQVHEHVTYAVTEPMLRGSHTWKGPMVVLMLCCSCLEIYKRFEHGVAHFHLALGPTNHVASPVLDPGPYEDHPLHCLHLRLLDETPGLRGHHTFLSGPQHHLIQCSINYWQLD